MVFKRTPNRPSNIKISPKEWKASSLQFKEKIEKLDEEIYKILSHLWSEEFMDHPETQKKLEEMNILPKF